MSGQLDCEIISHFLLALLDEVFREIINVKQNAYAFHFRSVHLINNLLRHFIRYHT